MSERPYEFVFSFRSPYAWIAAEAVIPKLSPGLDLRWRPFFPLPAFTNFPPLIPGKTRYLVHDVIRLTKFYDLKLEFPSVDDLDWAIPHAAFERADELGRGPDFARALFAARWSRGESVFESGVIASAARSIETDENEILRAALDPGRREALRARVQFDYDERGVFGVPTLIAPDKQRYWGHETIEWALREGFLPGRDA